MTMRTSRGNFTRSSGVTLIELAITIALVGILAALIVQFVSPVRSYIDTSRRAALADTADTALRRIGRDLRLALPNSVRVTTSGGVVYLEFLLVRTAGRYRFEAGTGTDCGGTTADDALVFGAADTCFTSIGGILNRSEVVSTDYLVVFNLQPGTDKGDAYQTTCGSACNKSQISATLPAVGTDGDVIKFASNTFTYESPGRRFFIIEGPVTYACDVSGGTLKRYSGYGIAFTQPTPPGGSPALIASGVNGCSFTYDNVAGAANQGAGLVTMRLQLRAQSSDGANEDVTLYHAVHVSNVP
ncbi:MAG TPA: prepilin-type N-terminal cleavage/methylation domain-containing protein [Steroidobacteraceae bacterium]